jgi:hypothetical protein
MRNARIAAFAWFVTIALFIGGAVATPATSAIEEVEQRLVTALDARDRPALEKLLTDHFNWIHASDGRVDTRDAWLANAARGMALWPLDLALHQRYVGDYIISADRRLVLAWEDGGLQATFPNGARTQIFLASPTEEASRTTGAGRLKFTLGEDGRPLEASLVRGDQEVWRAKRSMETRNQ